MSCVLAPYHMVARDLAKTFSDISFKHISCVPNSNANELA